jgi:hypothetical protein
LLKAFGLATGHQSPVNLPCEITAVIPGDQRLMLALLALLYLCLSLSSARTHPLVISPSLSGPSLVRMHDGSWWGGQVLSAQEHLLYGPSRRLLSKLSLYLRALQPADWLPGAGVYGADCVHNCNALPSLLPVVLCAVLRTEPRPEILQNKKPPLAIVPRLICSVDNGCVACTARQTQDSGSKAVPYVKKMACAT